MSETVMEKKCNGGRTVKVRITEDGHVIVENPQSADVIYNMVIGGSDNRVEFKAAGEDYIAVHTRCDSNGVTAELSRCNNMWWSVDCRPAIRLLPCSMSKTVQHFMLELRKGGMNQFAILNLLPVKTGKNI